MLATWAAEVLVGIEASIRVAVVQVKLLELELAHQ